MAKYYWTIDSLKAKLKILNKMLQSEKDPKRKNIIVQDIENIHGALDEYYDDTPNNQVKLLEGYDIVKESLGDIPFLWEDFKEFNEITQEPLIFIPELKKASLSQKDILDLTHDFYKSLNRFFFGNFMKNFSRRYDHIAFHKYSFTPFKGETVALTSTKEAYINITRNFTLDDVITTIHEYSHATSASINYRHLYYPKNLYSEIDTIFMELIGADYLEDIFGNGQALLNRTMEHGRYAVFSDSLTAQIQLIEYEKTQNRKFTNNKSLKQAASIFDILPNEIENILTRPNTQDSMYLTSYLFALELYNLYLEDKEKALYYLKKIIFLDCQSEEQYYCNIKRFGFIPNLSTQKVHTKFTNEAIKLTRKKSKK